ncbi:MAG: HAMP domain-containing protein [Deltaproteobacteria bacterium]|nr:HAMP domain-containing protein [Deltaproteobacteria bacterium]
MTRVRARLRGLSALGLRFQVIGLMTALTVFLVLALGSVWLRLMERNFVRMKFETGSAIHASFQAMIALEWEGRTSLVIGDADRQRLTEIALNFANHNTLTEIFVVDADRRIAGHERFDLLGEPYHDEDFDKAFAGLTIVHTFLPSDAGGGIDPDDRVQITAPIFLGKHVAGAVRLGVPMGDAAAALAATRRVLILYTILTAILTTIVGTIALMRLIIRPVSELAAATARITEGDYGHKIPIRSENEIGVLARALANLHLTLRDRDRKVTEQRTHLRSAAERLERAEAEVLQQDRLAYLGRVTAGVAHEVGNPLGAINNYLGVLSGSPDLAGEDAEIVTRIQREVDRIDRIMRELLDFSRPRRAQLVPTDLAELARECVTILRDQRQVDRVALDVSEPPAPLPEVQVDRAQLKQVLLNGLINARDAIAARDESGSGRVEIAFEVAPFTDTLLLESRLPAAANGEDRAAFTDLARRGIAFSSPPPFARDESLVMAHLRDDGPGLGAEQAQRVFEPFFTTKEPGRGTGLGLAICQRIVENFGGVLRFESRDAARGAPTGTVFSVVLPLARRERARPANLKDDVLAILGEPEDEHTSESTGERP